MLRKLEKSQYIGLVRKLPPLIPAVKLSARSLNGNILHRAYMAILSGRLVLVVLRIPTILERILLIMAMAIPLRTIRRKKSIRKKKNDPLRV